MITQAPLLSRSPLNQLLQHAIYRLYIVLWSIYNLRWRRILNVPTNHEMTCERYDQEKLAWKRDFLTNGQQASVGLFFLRAVRVNCHIFLPLARAKRRISGVVLFRFCREYPNGPKPKGFKVKRMTCKELLKTVFNWKHLNTITLFPATP